jgi:hypothetical protein
VNESADTGALAVGVAAMVKLPENGTKVRRKLNKNPISMYARRFISSGK